MPVSFSIPLNAKADKPFRAPLQSSPAVAVLDVEGVDTLGLCFDKSSGTLSGTPSTPGEHTLKVVYQMDEDSPPVEGGVTLTVIPDPKTLWKNLPSRLDDPLWKADAEGRHLRTDTGFVLVGASKRGRSHAHVGGFREEDFFLASAGGWQVVAVADGAGSAARSRRGSRIAAKRAGEALLDALSADAGAKLVAAIGDESTLTDAKTQTYHMLGNAALAAVTAIEREAEQAATREKDYSTTLLLAFHKKTEHGHLIGSYWVGDGAIGAYSRKTGPTLLGSGDSGEYAGQTRFLVRSLLQDGEAIMSRIRLEILPELTALILMTDGVTDAKFGTDDDLEDAKPWDALWQELEALLKQHAPERLILDWLDFWSPGNHDDRTIAVLWNADP